MSDEGFIMLDRGFFAHHIWDEERRYSRAEAWLDCIQQASFRTSKRFIAGSLIEIPRGGFVASVRYLSDRWKWSNTKVCAFLESLEKEAMIRREKRSGNTLVLLCKFELFNSEKRRQKRHRNDAETTVERQSNDEVEEGKEGKDSGANGSHPPPSPLANDEAWFSELSSDPAYQGIEVPAEAGKMKRWCEVNGKQPTRRRFVNWLNRIERPMRERVSAPPIPMADPPGWRDFLTGKQLEYMPHSNALPNWRAAFALR